MTEESSLPKRTIARPGIITFVAVMMFVLGGILLVTAIEEFSNGAWLKDVSFGLFGRQFVVWAVIDTILGLVSLAAGYSLLKGGNFGWWVAMIIAVLAAVRWFFYIPWLPVGALIGVTIAVIIIYGLSAHTEYFDQ